MKTYLSDIVWVAPLLLAVVARGAESDLITFGAGGNFADHRPILIAHRGGVVSAQSHECSLTAIRLAAKDGYDMVELDVRRSRDGIPMVFHDDDLMKACGKKGKLGDFTAAELEMMRYTTGEDSIMRVDNALAECRRLQLGVMLDIKAGQESGEFLEGIDQLLVKHGLDKSTITITSQPAVRQFLRHVIFTPTPEEMRHLRAGDSIDLRQRFWFGIPQRLQAGDLPKLQAAGALILPAINTFRYPSDRHMELAKKDIEWLRASGVDGFQIDSVYNTLIRK